MLRFVSKVPAAVAQPYEPVPRKVGSELAASLVVTIFWWPRNSPAWLAWP